MKTLIKSSALVAVLALLSTGVFATEKTSNAPEVKKQDVILFTGLEKGCGVGVAVHKAEAGKPIVTITDATGKVILKDALSKKDDVAQMGYNLSELADGDYTFTVTTNNKVTNRIVHVFSDDNDQKSFFFKM
jgi:hypothetical protein